MINRKSQDLSFNVIVIAALALIVLVVLWAIFTGRMGKFVTGLKETEEQARCTDDIIGGQVITLSEDVTDCPEGKTKIPGKFRDIEEGKAICCTK